MPHIAEMSPSRWVKVVVESEAHRVLALQMLLKPSIGHVYMGMLAFHDSFHHLWHACAYTTGFGGTGVRAAGQLSRIACIVVPQRTLVATRLLI